MVPTICFRCKKPATTPEERVHNVVVGLAGASVTYLRGGWEEGVARSAVGAAAKAAEGGAQAEDAERGRGTRSSLGQANERTSALTTPRCLGVALDAGAHFDPTRQGVCDL